MTKNAERKSLLGVAAANIDLAKREVGNSPAIEALIDSVEALLEICKLEAPGFDIETLIEVTKHTQHHIFDLDTGKIIRSKCNCGTEFMPGSSCEEWKRHILSLAKPRSIDGPFR